MGFKNWLNMYFALIFLLGSSVSLAGNPLGVSLNSELNDTRISEYFYNRSRSDYLIPVKLIGRVGRPGLYHIPKTTSLLTLIAISGGPKKEANTKYIQVSKPSGAISVYNLNSILKSGTEIKLDYGDVIFIPKEERLFDEHTSTMVSTISAIVGLVLTSLVLVNQK